MPDKPPQEDSRRIWERVLSSLPHGVKVRTVSVGIVGEGGQQVRSPDPAAQPLEPRSSEPFGDE